MSAEIIDTMLSLITLMEEESAKLVTPGPHLDLAEMSAAKVRLVATLEAQTTLLERERPDWLQQLDDETRKELADVVLHLHDASVINSTVLSRQIDLCTEMMAAVAAAAQRAMGTSSATYGAHGGLFQIDQATPISLNARY